MRRMVLLVIAMTLAACGGGSTATRGPVPAANASAWGIREASSPRVMKCGRDATLTAFEIGPRPA